MEKSTLFLIIFLSISFGLIFQFGIFDTDVSVNTKENTVLNKSEDVKKVLHKEAPVSYTIAQKAFVSQTFNNCGPASLSMIMSYFGKDVSQGELASLMRPFNNPQGGIDDKSIFADEFVSSAKKYGFESLHRPDGDLELLKLFIANDIPVVVRTWLHPDEDIGHFRIVRGYDDTTGNFIQDDSYEGPNLRYDYATFERMWKPFNFGYILVYPQEKAEIVSSILGSEIDEKVAYTHARERSQMEIDSGNGDMYSYFNLSTSQYYLGNYQESIDAYEKVATELPSRMLWYQYEVLDAYRRIGDDEKVLSVATSILNRENTAYSEMYLLRGYVYEENGERDRARLEFEKAVFYNTQKLEARQALDRINS